MKTYAKPPLAEAIERNRSKKPRRAVRVSSPVMASATKCGPHLRAMYARAFACIADADLKARVKAILVAASEVTAAKANTVERKLAAPAKELHALALRSPAVANALIVIVEHWGMGQRCLAIQALAAHVVSALIIDGRLDRTQTASAVRGMVAAWCDIFETWNLEFGSNSNTTGAVAEFIFCVILTSLQRVAEMLPHLVISAFFLQVDDSPLSVYYFCKEQFWGCDDAELAGLCAAVKNHERYEELCEVYEELFQDEEEEAYEEEDEEFEFFEEEEAE